MPSPQPQRTITAAALEDLPYIVHLQRIWSNQVGFLPKSALERYIDSKNTLLVKERGQHAGYLNWTVTRNGLLRFIQIAIDPPLLRTALGTRLVNFTEDSARRNKCSLIRFQCRTDLFANHLWQALGFYPSAIYHRQTARRKPCLEWTKNLIEPSRFFPNGGRRVGLCQTTGPSNEDEDLDATTPNEDDGRVSDKRPSPPMS